MTWWEILILLGVWVAALLLNAVLSELRKLRKAVENLHSGEQENARSLGAAVHELGASLLRANKPSSISDRRAPSRKPSPDKKNSELS
jgi:hypothetical protein